VALPSVWQAALLLRPSPRGGRQTAAHPLRHLEFAQEALAAAQAGPGVLDCRTLGWEPRTVKHHASNKDDAEAHMNLGLALLQRGQCRQAAVELRRGDELGSRNPLWPHVQAQAQIRQAEQMARLDDRFPGVLQGKDRPKDAAERVAFAQLCQLARKQFTASARFYGEAFAAQPALAGDLSAGHRYNAACAAALAGCGQGQGAAGLDDKERARLRRQALDWLTSELQAWHRVLEKEHAKARPAVAQQMRHWLHDTDFNGVRGAEALARLPEAERQPWRQLWADVADTLARAREQGRPAEEKPSPAEAPRTE
jgi:hypothetical protein